MTLDAEIKDRRELEKVLHKQYGHGLTREQKTIKGINCFVFYIEQGTLEVATWTENMGAFVYKKPTKVIRK